MDLAHETVFEMRNLILRGVILSVDDTGQAQTITVKTGDGIVRSGIEVEQIFGVASMPPAEGGVALLLAVGGDPGHYVALPLTNPSYRFGKLQAGDGGVIYAQDGSRVRILAEGVVEVLGFTQVIVKSPKVAITAPHGVTILGDLTVQGSVTARGNTTTGTGASGSFTTPTGQVVTVRDGVITNIF